MGCTNSKSVEPKQKNDQIAAKLEKAKRGDNSLIERLNQAKKTHDQARLLKINKITLQLSRTPYVLFFHNHQMFNLLNEKFINHSYDAVKMKFMKEKLEFELISLDAQRLTKAQEIFNLFLDEKAKISIVGKVKPETIEEIKNAIEEVRLDKENEHNVNPLTLPKTLLDTAAKEIIDSFGEDPIPEFSTEVSDLLKASWTRIIELGGGSPIKFGQLFYKDLFVASPELKTLFVSRTPHRQAILFSDAIDKTLTDFLFDFDGLIKYYSGLANRHKGYGCHTGQFSLTGKVFLSLLKRVEGDNWETVKPAWDKLFKVLAVIMCQWTVEPELDKKTGAQKFDPNSTECTLV